MLHPGSVVLPRQQILPPATSRDCAITWHVQFNESAGDGGRALMYDCLMLLIWVHIANTRKQHEHLFMHSTGMYRGGLAGPRTWFCLGSTFALQLDDFTRSAQRTKQRVVLFCEQDLVESTSYRTKVEPQSGHRGFLQHLRHKLQGLH